jgi:hypothetical protein
MLQEIKNRVHKYFLKKELRFHKPERSITGIADASDIGILMDASDADRIILVNQFADSIRTQFRKISILGYYNFPKPAMNLNFQHFYNKQLNWYLEPQGYIVDDFIGKKFDVLINAYQGENLPLEYISAMSNAKYRIGLYEANKTYLSDVMIDMKGAGDLKEILDQFKNYIFIIK